MAQNGGIGLMETHSVGTRGVHPESSPAETREVSLKASKVGVECQTNLADDDSEDVCRICWAPGDESPLYYPCACRGTIKYVHEDCLLQWLNHSSGRQCQICKHAFAFSPVYAENTPTKLSFRELLLGVVSKADLVKLRLLLQWLASLAFLWIGSAHEIPFTIPVKSASIEALLFVLFLIIVFAKLFCLRPITPRILTVVLAKPVTLALARWIFPSFGYSVIINSAVNRFSLLGFRGLGVVWRVVKGLLDLHNGIRDDLYLLGRRLQNYRGREKNEMNYLVQLLKVLADD